MSSMSNLRFQLQAVGGKPQIFFGEDREAKNARKFGYKNRDQRFPLREKVPPEEPPPPRGRAAGAAKPPATRKAAAPAQKRPVSGAKKAPGGGTVTLTQEQLEMILSSVGKTAAADRDNSVRISVERTDGGVNIETEASPRRRTRARRRGGRESDDEDSALGETADTGGSGDEDERRPAAPAPGRRRPAQASRAPAAGKGGESVYSLLAKAGTGGGDNQASRQPRRKPAERETRPQREPVKPPGKRVEIVSRKEPPAPKKKAGAKQEAMSEEDMDRKMQRIIAENKDKMSEAELVDLLAAVYLEEKQKVIQGGKKDPEEEEDRRNRGRQEKKVDRRERDEDERRRAGEKRDDKKKRVRYDRREERDRRDRDEEDERDRAERRRDPRSNAKDDDESYDEETSRNRNRRRTRMRRDSDEVELDYSSEEDRRKPARKRETRRPRRHDDYDDEEEEEVVQTRFKKQSEERGRGRGRKRSEASEDEAKAADRQQEEKPQVEAPRFLTMAEKKRLQWEKEREELKNLKSYDPWGKPGAGAPPKESPVPTAMSKKEEEQQRYARELAEQVKEKREKEQKRDDRQSGGGGLMEVDGGSLQLSGSFARGRGMANLDEKTRTDLDERRRRQVEHQEAIKKQVEERQATRAKERERRIQEEQEEEARLQRERDRLQKQYEDEQVRTRRREVEHESRLAQLQAANEAAEQAAKIEKARRRMERLEGGGHDTSALRANFEAELTARSQAGAGANVPGLSRPAEVQLTTYTRAAAVPGLEGIAEVTDSQQMTGRWATPRDFQFQQMTRSIEVPTKEDQVQTDPSLLQPLLQQAMELAAMTTSTAHAQDQPVRRKERAPPSQAPTQRPTVRHTVKTNRYQRGFVVDTEKPPTGRPGQPIPVTERPRWGNANPGGRRALKQSEREVSDGKRQDREMRRARREAELMAKVDANQRRIPRAKPARRASDSGSPGPGPNWQIDEGPVYMGTYNLDGGAGGYPGEGGPLTVDNRDMRFVPTQRTGRTSPPVPTLRKAREYGGPMAVSRSEENLAAAVRAEGLGNFPDVGLVRTSEVLNPAKAERPLPLSREDTERQLARRTYLKGLNPAHYGDYMANLDDHRMEQALPNKTTNAKNPIFNPGIVKDIPTPRQDAILQHLSDIRKNLLQKQKEIETSLSMGDNLA